jgi:superfamily II DNA or RNA helicase
MGRLTFPVLTPGEAAIAASLFVPKTLFSEKTLEALVSYGVDDDAVTLYRTHAHHYEVARNSLSLDGRCPIHDYRPTEFPDIGLRPKESFVPREPQVRAMAALRDSGGDATIALACGKGKTIMAWAWAAELRGPVLFAAPQRAHLDNAYLELVRVFDFSGTVGWLHENESHWDRDVVFTTVARLVKLLESRTLPPAFHRRFALTIYDEAHHLSAASFSKTGDTSQGRRLGLTATVKRRDGKEGIFMSHLGPVVYEDTEQDLTPEVHLVEHPEPLTPEEEKEAKDSTNEIHVGKLRRVLGLKPSRIARIVKAIQKDLDDGRTVYVLAHSPEGLVALHSHFPWAGLILQGVSSTDRLKELNKAKLTFATANIGAEAYNRADLDCLHFVTVPGAKEGVAVQLEQGIGRILRAIPDKRTPLVRLHIDTQIELCMGLGFAAVRYCRERNWPVFNTERIYGKTRGVDFSARTLR